MKPVSLTRAALGAALVVGTQPLVKSVFGALYHRVPEYHAFWSGLVLYSEAFAFFALPGVVTLWALADRTHRDGEWALLASASTVVAVVAGIDGGWTQYLMIYSALVAAVFGSVYLAGALRDRRNRSAGARLESD